MELGVPIAKDGRPRSIGKEDVPDGRPILGFLKDSFFKMVVLLGEHFRCKIVITEDKEFKNFIDKMIANANVGILVGTHSWRQQFVEALTVEDIDGGAL